MYQINPEYTYIEDVVEKQTIVVKPGTPYPTIQPVANFVCRIVGYKRDSATPQPERELVYVLAVRDANGESHLYHIRAIDFWTPTYLSIFFCQDDAYIEPGMAAEMACAVWTFTYREVPLPCPGFVAKSLPDVPPIGALEVDVPKKAEKSGELPIPPLHPSYFSYELETLPELPVPVEDDDPYIIPDTVPLDAPHIPGGVYDTSQPEVFLENDFPHYKPVENKHNLCLWKLVKAGADTMRYLLGVLHARVVMIQPEFEGEPETYDIGGHNRNGEQFHVSITAADYWNPKRFEQVMNSIPGCGQLIRDGMGGPAARAIWRITTHESLGFTQQLVDEVRSVGIFPGDSKEQGAGGSNE